MPDSVKSKLDIELKMKISVHLINMALQQKAIAKPIPTVRY